MSISAEGKRSEESMTELGTFLAGGVVISGLALGGMQWFRRGQRKLPDALREFFGTPPQELPIARRTFTALELPNLQLAVERLVEQRGGTMRAIGYTVSMTVLEKRLKNLIGGTNFLENVRVSAPSYRQVDVDLDRQLRCLEDGLFLIEAQGKRYAIHLREETFSRSNNLELEVMTATAEAAGELVEAVRRLAVEANVYRGKVISLERGGEFPGEKGHRGVRFHRLAPIATEELILPPATLALLERNTVGFFRHADALRRSGRSVRRGLLLHGKPGTGKTYTARWLAQRLGVTTILMAGDQLGLIKECCRIARMLAPSLVIMEDVDLIAAERNESRHPAYQVTLHTLLNEMDGVSSDAEVLFLLTTNRPETIEPALAGRPGRIDQAIEFPLPDADCRNRLLELYGRGLVLELDRQADLVKRTEGASPAFIQELVRKAALAAAEAGSTSGELLRVTDAHFEAALAELILGGGELTRQLLGFPGAHLES